VEYYAGTESNGMTAIDSATWLTRPGTVGRAVLGTPRICADDGTELPAGEIGSVYFESDAIPFTYHNDPEKTRAAQHPQHPAWTTLGDIGYLDEDGFLFLTDRKAFMIISGGVNIYPQETENVLALHPAVYDVAVIGVPDPEMGESVAAFIQPAAGAVPGPELAQEIVTFVKSKIASFKAPKVVRFVDDLPRTETGKLMKSELKAKYARSSTSSAPPRARASRAAPCPACIPADLLATDAEALVERNGLTRAGRRRHRRLRGQVGDQSLNIARTALLAAGFPESVPGTTVDRQCGSSQQAAHFAAQGVIAGAYDIVIACGVESMSRVPIGSSRPAAARASRCRPVPRGPGQPGHRRRADRRPVEARPRGARRLLGPSHRGPRDRRRGRLRPRDHPGACPRRRRSRRRDRPRRDHRRGLAGLRPSFYTEEMAARFPGDRLADHPGQLLAADRRRLGRADHERGEGGRARPAAAGQVPRLRGGPARSAADADRADPGYRARCWRAAACRSTTSTPTRSTRPSRRCRWPGREFGADPARLNPRGGAIALGHPLGGSGTKLMATLLNHLEQTGGRYGLQTMCEGGGMANATIIERF
jgi:hypothetical protein